MFRKRLSGNAKLCALLIFSSMLFGVVVLDANASGFTHQDENAREVDFFEKRIRPVLVEHCFECHSANSERLEGGLLVDSKQGLLDGGDTAPAVVPGDVDASMILEALRYESIEMPPDQKLPDHVIEDFAAWIEAGAVDPREEVDHSPAHDANQVVQTANHDEHWAFQPLRLPQFDDAVKPGIVDSAIDRLIRLHQETHNTSLPERASRRVLVRRAYLDLTGLPPTPEQIESFLADDAPDAWPRLIDRLLASPRFGERWGRHWLDAARYADSSGGGRAILLPLAYRYRDYVIGAMNTDKPYDQFVVEQIAGDLLPADSFERQADQLTGLGFLVLGPTNYELQDKELLRMEVVDEQLDTMGRAILGMSIGCARCHDHKFDPIPTRDYYALAGILRSTKTLLPGNVSGFVTRELPMSPEEMSAWSEHQGRVQTIQASIDEMVVQHERVTEQIQSLRLGLPVGNAITIDETKANLAGNWTSSTSVSSFVGAGYHHSSEDSATAQYEFNELEPTPVEIQLAYTPHGNRASNAVVEIHHAEGVTRQTINQKQRPSFDGQYQSLGRFHPSDDGRLTLRLLCRGANGVVIADAVRVVVPLDTGDTPDQAENERAIADAEKQLENINASRAALESELASVRNSAPPAPSKAMAVEDESTVEDFHVCVRGNVHRLGEPVDRGTLTGIGLEKPLVIADESSGRLELAQWLVDEQNPLTARVHANRVWHHLVGRGLVRTIDNFGTTGESPVMPDLLDYLALKLMEADWSTKSIVREIMLSDAYCSVSLSSTEVGDPRVFHGRVIRRLDAEVLRDSMLLVSGDLNRSIGGPAILPGTKNEFDARVDSNRRSVYLPVFRNRLDEFLSSFDFANPNIVSGGRVTTTLPTQSLFLMNNAWVAEQATLTARRVMSWPMDDAARLDRLFIETVGREPSPEERQLFVRLGIDPANPNDRASIENWATIAQTLFACLDYQCLH